MNAQERLNMLKQDLEMISESRNDYLSFLLLQAERILQIEGVENDGTEAYEGVLISYAAYLFRKRAADSSGGKDGQTGMPRFLRIQINNLIISQKAGGAS